MAWIESHQELGRHPKTRRAARALGLSVPTLLGHLHLLWWWALDFAQDGDLSRFELQEIAEAAMWESEPETFVHGLVSAGFLDDGERLSLHDWQEYAGKLLGQRRANAAKQQAWRDRQRQTPPDDAGTLPLRNGNVTGMAELRNGATVQNSTITVPNPTEVISPSNSVVQHQSIAPHDAARVSAAERPKPQRQKQKAEPTTIRASPPAPSQPRPEEDDRRDSIWDTLVTVLEYEPRGKSERSNWGRVVHGLKEAEATPGQIVQAARRWRLLYPDARLTINVFDGHWGELADRNEHSNGHQPTDPDAARAQELERVNRILILRGEAPLEALPADWSAAGMVGQGPGRAAG